MSINSIARRLNRSASTLSREIRRQGAPGYAATSAASTYRLRRRACVRRRRLVEGSALFQQVRDDLVLYRCSPRQIAAKLKAMHPDDPSQCVSHETIHAAIYAHPRGGLKKEFVEAPGRHKPTRGLRPTTAAKRTWVPEELRIVHRPGKVAQRLIPGHWEGDLIKGAFNRRGRDRNVDQYRADQEAGRQDALVAP
nr:IS30 family transposase [Xanthomonas oryzae]